jgi:hypothetical protein
MVLCEKVISPNGCITLSREDMDNLVELRNQLFQFLMKNAGKKFTVAEIAKSFKMESTVNQFCPYGNLSSLLDQMAAYALIETKPENGSMIYFISK